MHTRTAGLGQRGLSICTLDRLWGEHGCALQVGRLDGMLRVELRTPSRHTERDSVRAGSLRGPRATGVEGPGGGLRSHGG